MQSIYDYNTNPHNIICIIAFVINMTTRGLKNQPFLDTVHHALTLAKGHSLSIITSLHG